MKSYWEQEFVAGRCFRDFYYGKVHFLVKASRFFYEGLEINDACIYYGNWNLDLTLALNYLDCSCNQLIKNQQLILFEDLNNYSPLAFFSGCSSKYLFDLVEEKSKSYHSVRLLWHLPYYDESIYTDKFNLTSSKINGYLENRKLCIIFFCNFGVFLPGNSLVHQINCPV